MDADIRKAERSQDQAAIYKAWLRAGKITEGQLKVLACCGDEAAAQVIEFIPLPCSRDAPCIGHFARYIETVCPDAKHPAQKFVYQQMFIAREDHWKTFGWNAPGENAAWIRMERAKDLADRSSYTVSLSKTLMDYAADIAGHPSWLEEADASVIAEVSKFLRKWAIQDV